MKKIRIYPNPIQKQILKKWFGTRRYVYNRCLENIKNNDEKINFMSLRNKFVTSKNNENVKEWESETPKDIRAGAIRDLVKNYNVAISNLRNGNIDSFNLHFQNRKNNCSLEIPKTSISYRNNKISIFKTYINDGIKVSRDKKYLRDLTIEYDCRLSHKYDKYYICVPSKTYINREIPKGDVCSLDPGVRKFQVLYSENETIKFSIEKECTDKLYSKLNYLQSLRDRKIIKKQIYRKKINKLYYRLSCLIDELHYSTINYIVNNYKVVFLPNFESQEIVRKMKGKNNRRNILNLNHYKFKERLKNKCDTRYSKLIICTEEYTSKTCGRCGTINNNLGCSEVFCCEKCGLTIDRDINGSRNIMIKNISSLGVQQG